MLCLKAIQRLDISVRSSFSDFHSLQGVVHRHLRAAHQLDSKCDSHKRAICSFRQAAAMWEESFSTADARTGEVVPAGRYEVLPELANLTVENATEACAGTRQGDRLARRR